MFRALLNEDKSVMEASDDGKEADPKSVVDSLRPEEPVCGRLFLVQCGRLSWRAVCRTRLARRTDRSLQTHRGRRHQRHLPILMRARQTLNRYAMFFFREPLRLMRMSTRRNLLRRRSLEWK